ncbi:MAG: hypothetical protein RJA70_1854 [Pseudomonadota bacterium]|jgi:phage shock protein A
MGILDRASRLISSNFNALLDAAEDPRKSLEQTLREMQQQLKLAKSELVRAVAAERQLKSKVSELEQAEETWEKRAELAVNSGDDALAREALAQRRRVQVDKVRTETLRTEQRGNALEMKSALQTMQQKFQDFSNRKNTIATQAQIAKHGGGVQALGASGGASAFEAFKNIEDGIDGVDDVFEAQREVNQALERDGSVTGMTRSEVELKFRELEGRAVGGGAPPEGLDDELDALKQKLRIRV